MKGVRKRVCCFIFVILFVCYNLVPVYAGDSPDVLNEGQLKIAEEIYIFLVNDMKISKAAACGVLGNADAESTFDPTLVSTSGYHGIYQMNTNKGLWQACCSWASSENLDVNDPIVQTKYAMACLKQDFAAYTKSLTYDEWCKTDDPLIGAEGFMVVFERCVGGGGTYSPVKVKFNGDPQVYQDGANRVEWSKAFLKKFAGVDVTSGTSDSSKTKNTDNNNNDTENATDTDSNTTTGYVSPVTGNFYTENALSSYARLAELNIDEKYLANATRDSLDQQSLTNLANWGRNVDNITDSHDLIYWLRVLTMFLGIMLTVWSLLLYIAFWFDKLSNFVELDALGVLTLGKLHVAPDDNDANFSITKENKEVRVSHKDILKVCLISLAFSTLVLTGMIYNIISILVNFVLRILG